MQVVRAGTWARPCAVRQYEASSAGPPACPGWSRNRALAFLPSLTAETAGYAIRQHYAHKGIFNMKTKRNPDTVHEPLAAYAHGIEISGPQRWLVLSGQVGMDAGGNLPSDPVEQFRIALGNVDHNLQAANMAIGDIVRLTIYLAGEIDPEERRLVLSSWLKGHQPCMTLLHVAALASPDIRVEIETLACTDSD